MNSTWEEIVPWNPNSGPEVWKKKTSFVIPIRLYTDNQKPLQAPLLFCISESSIDPGIWDPID